MAKRRNIGPKIISAGLAVLASKWPDVDLRQRWHRRVEAEARRRFRERYQRRAEMILFRHDVCDFGFRIILAAEASLGPMPMEF